MEGAEFVSNPLPAEGSIVRGFVSHAAGKGCFLRLSHAVTGHVLMKDLSDEFIDDPAAAFPMGKLVHARVLSVDQVLFLLLQLLKLESALLTPRELNLLNRYPPR